MDYPDVWNLMRQAWRAVVACYDPVFDHFLGHRGLDGWSVGLLLTAWMFEPDSATTARLQVRGPYTAAAVYRSRLLGLEEQGFLAQGEPGEFRLTALGREDILSLIQEIYRAMQVAHGLPDADANRLCELIGRLVDVSLNTPPPPDLWSIRLSYKVMPPISMPLPYFEQAVSCLSAYRDDAHRAAWQPSGLSAPALESLTLLWRHEADSLDSLSQCLVNRGFGKADYAEALAELRDAGYIEGADEAPRPTIFGRSFRQQVEEDTDRYFFAPWDCLEDNELVELADLCTRLRDTLGGTQA